jgi:DNA-binding CsgD family transcriptional regulator
MNGARRSSRGAHREPAARPHLTPGQRRVAEALLGSPRGNTYVGVAAALGISLGTVYTQLRRLRDAWPELYAEIMAIRGEQLANRHSAALWRARAHSQQWHRAQSARRHYRRFGCWPSERRLYKQLGRLDLLAAWKRSRGFE